MTAVPSTEEAIAATREWLEKAVIGLNLCPFARSVYTGERVRFIVSEATTPGALLDKLADELETLHAANPQTCETTLLIHPRVLTDFLDYNDFLDAADALLEDMGLEGEIQLASFHPHYQFADVEADDITNYTNRSPYPTLHLLREDSISRAVDAVPDTDAIIAKNVETMKRLGQDGWRRLWKASPEEPS